MNPPGPPIVVRDARPEDLDAIIGFNLRLAEETESKALDREILARGVSMALADPADRLRYWIADHDDLPVGQAAISREWSDWRCGWIWWLQSVYVAPEARGRGAFRCLFARIGEVARSTEGVIGLRLYVEEHNEPARRTYLALGMMPGGYDVFEQFWPSAGRRP